jgi:hypothetical protein
MSTTSSDLTARTPRQVYASMISLIEVPVLIEM